MTRAPFGVIGCGKAKRPHAAEARDLYTSAWFKTRRNAMEARHVPYVIASAAHGFVPPSRVLAPYDATFTDGGGLTPEEFAATAALIPRDRLVIVAVGSRLYLERVLDALSGRDDLTFDTRFSEGGLTRYRRIREWGAGR